MLFNAGTVAAMSAIIASATGSPINQVARFSKRMDVAHSAHESTPGSPSHQLNQSSRPGSRGSSRSGGSSHGKRHEVKSVTVPLAITSEPVYGGIFWTAEAKFVSDEHPLRLIVDTGPPWDVVLSTHLSEEMQKELVEKGFRMHNVRPMTGVDRAHTDRPTDDFKDYNPIRKVISYSGGLGNGELVHAPEDMSVGGVNVPGVIIGSYTTAEGVTEVPNVDGVFGVGLEADPPGPRDDEIWLKGMQDPERPEGWYAIASRKQLLNNDGFTIDIVYRDPHDPQRDQVETGRHASATFGECLCPKNGLKWRTATSYIGGYSLRGPRNAYILLDSGDPHLTLYRDDIEEYIRHCNLGAGVFKRVEDKGMWHMPCDKMHQLKNFHLHYVDPKGVDSFQKEIPAKMLMGPKTLHDDKQCWIFLKDVDRREDYRLDTDIPILIYGAPFFMSMTACFHHFEGFAFCRKSERRHPLGKDLTVSSGPQEASSGHQAISSGHQAGSSGHQVSSNTHKAAKP